MTSQLSVRVEIESLSEILLQSFRLILSLNRFEHLFFNTHTADDKVGFTVCYISKSGELFMR